MMIIIDSDIMYFVWSRGYAGVFHHFFLYFLSAS
jgi:hypothetical protein